jgi:pyruvate formate lyase activating enzyme
VRAIAEWCNRKNLSVALETCAHVSWDCFKNVLKYIDIVLFDIKHMDSALHEKYCGSSNYLIHENLKRLAKLREVEIVIRIPIIPNYNDSNKNLSSTARFIKSLDGNIMQIDLLPYHRLGESKWERLGCSYSLKGIEPPTNEHMQEIEKLFLSYDLNVQIGG